jgi:hypothetical protein
VQPYRWYWRIEPDVHFHCDLRFDPFLYMQDREKVYGEFFLPKERKRRREEGGEALREGESPF